MSAVRITPVALAERDALEQMATGYFREVLPKGPPFVPGTLDSYWLKRGRHPYFIGLDGQKIGFALVWTHPDGTHELAEFTINKAWRGKGLGTEAAQLVFHALGGDWTLGVASTPPGALSFWRQCLEACEGACEIVQGPPKTPSQCGSFSFRIARGAPHD